MNQPDTARTSRSALALVRAEHARIDALFKDYGLLSGAPGTSAADRDALIARVGATLGALVKLEEELLYPLLEGRVDRAELQAAFEDHRGIEAQLQRVAGGADDSVAMDQEMTHLAELARAHLKLEEERLLPAAEAIDSASLYERMALRRAELQGEQGPD